jgi:hypothetical protein
MMLVDGDVEDARKFAGGVANLRLTLAPETDAHLPDRGYISSSGSNLPFPALPFHFLL